MLSFKKGTLEDVQAAFDLIVELAIYERAPEKVSNTVAQMKIDGFGTNPIYEFYLAFFEGEPVGLALYYPRYSTWRGRCVYLEELIVTEKHRGLKIGKKLLDIVVREALAQNAVQISWQVLDWNEKGINFYKKFEANLDDEWINCSLNRQQMLEWKPETHETHKI